MLCQCGSSLQWRNFLKLRRQLQTYYYYLLLLKHLARIQTGVVYPKVFQDSGLPSPAWMDLLLEHCWPSLWLNRGSKDGSS